MPGRPMHRRAASVATVLAAVQTWVFLLATRAMAAPVPDPGPASERCKLLSGPALQICRQRNESGSDSPPTNPLDTNPWTPSNPSPKAAPKPPPGLSASCRRQ